MFGSRRGKYQGKIGLSAEEIKAAKLLGHNVEGEERRGHIVEKNKKKAGRITHGISTFRRYEK